MIDEQNAKVASIVHTVRPSTRRLKADDASSHVDALLQRRLIEVVNRIGFDSVQPLLDVLRETLAPVMLDHLVRDQNGSWHVSHDHALPDRLPPQSGEQLIQWANQVCESGQATTERLSGAYTWSVVMVPVMFRQRAPEVLCAAFQIGSAEEQRVCSVLQLGAAHLSMVDIVRSESIAQQHAQRNAAVLELLSSLDNCDNASTAYQVLVDQLKDFLGCQRIALGLARTGKLDCRLIAVSGMAEFDKRSDFASGIEAAFNESILRKDVIVATATREKEARSYQALRASSQVATVLGSPLKAKDGSYVGSWVFFLDKAESDCEALQNFVRASDVIVGSRLAMLQRLQINPFRRLVAGMMRAFATRKFALAMFVIALIFAGFAVPTPYRISCDCQLEPVSRRFVAAPYDGTLEESFVAAGQIVTAGTLLARMDPRELQWELTGLKADHASEQKKRDAADAREEFALAQQSTLEMQRLALKMRLIEHRLDNLEIKSPIDGIVIAGDLENSVGAPLAIGQALFEIGPLDQMVVEVAIPECEILFVETGMQVEVRLDAAQQVTAAGIIRRISPRSETRDDESVYIAEVNFDNRDGKLRPGMKGSAKIISDPHPLGWNLMHRAWESLAMWIGV